MKKTRVPSSTSPKILIVEDDQNILEIVKEILTISGYEVCTHSTGLDVPRIVLNYQPNLILLDIGLPGKLGTDVCRELKQIHSIPIIFFSAHAEKVESIKSCAADGFIQKPFDMKNLVQTIKFHLN